MRYIFVSEEVVIYRTYKYHVSFRIRHPTINSEDICKELGLEAEFKWKAGEERKTPKGQILQGVNEESYCCFQLKPSRNTGLASFLKRNNKKLYRHKKFLDTIRSTGGKLEYFIGWFVDKDSGEIFDLELLKQLVDLGIDFSIAVYPDNKRDAEKI